MRGYTDASRSASSSFTSAMTLQQMGVPYVPQRYVLPPSQRPIPTSLIPSTAPIPIIDLSSLQNPSLRSQVTNDIRVACKEIGLFQVINHGVSPLITKDALDAASEFFDLPTEEKMLLGSDDIQKPVRYGTSLNHVKDKVHFWRDFIKLYSHPISKWIHLWPSNPLSFIEKMGNYAEAIRILQKQLMEVIIESLGLNHNYLQEEIEEGSQILAVNCYPACPEPELTLGIPPHSDFGSITILLQSCQGLEIIVDSDNESDENWRSVPAVEGALVVQLGDQMEVMSNGRYKSVVHRATVSSEKQRLSIAAFHSLALDKKIGPAPQLLHDQNNHPQYSYGEFSFQDFLDYASAENYDITKGRFIDTLKKKNVS